MSTGAHTKIWTHLVSQFEGIYVFDEIFSLSSIRNKRIEYDADNKGTWITHFSKCVQSSTLPRITGNGLFVEYEATVENLASSIIIHEWYSHRIKEVRTALQSHRLAYKNVINFKRFWKNTTNNYKGFTMRALLFYTKKETGRKNVDSLYRNLYNKYYKYRPK